MLYSLFSDALAALMCATLFVLVVGVILLVDWAWCSLIGWIFRIPKV